MRSCLWVVAALGCLMVQSAWADRVSFEVSSDFKPVSGEVKHFLGGYADTITVDFAAAAHVFTDPDVPPAAAFTIGEFSVKSKKKKDGFWATGFTDVPFSVTISQKKPSVGTGRLTAEIDGWVRYNSILDLLWVDFEDSDVTIGRATYHVKNMLGDKLFLDTPHGCDNPAKTSLQLCVNVAMDAVSAPVPSSAWMGITLLGGLGVSSAIRRKFAGE